MYLEVLLLNFGKKSCRSKGFNYFFLSPVEMAKVKSINFEEIACVITLLFVEMGKVKSRNFEEIVCVITDHSLENITISHHQ